MKSYPNILLVMGTGRNVGKTVSACNFIQRISKSHRPVGVKISAHFHELASNLKYLHNSEELVIVEEKNITQKDSSRMLQAGAEKVFYVQAKKEKLERALNFVLELIHPDQPLVVESGGLYEIIEPGLLFFITGENPKKEIQLREATNVIKVDARELRKFEWDSIQFEKGKFTQYA